MEAQNGSAPAAEKTFSPWLLVAYFVGILVFAKLGGMLFAMLEGSASLQGFAKLNAIIQESLDVVQHRDDSIVTVFSLLLTVLLVFPVGWVYTYTKKKAGFDPGLVQTLVVMAMVVCGMMMLIQDQFSRALALVGVVSAVRFRTNLRDPKDAVYLLIAIGIGMGAGLQVYRVALWMTIIMCITFLVLSRYKVGELPAGEGGFIDDKKDKKDKKKKKDKNGKGDEPPAGRLERIADSLKDKDRGVKRPNTVVLLEAVDSEAAIQFLSQTLGALEIPWHLVTVTPGDGFTTLEYLVRLDDGEVAVGFESQIEKALGNSVRAIDVKPVDAAA
ncbi:MAG: DUF4956 domain-containing protein [Acidobacteria bacterium]|nr:DUF4956 domain-containing protein [Acidobacteriota bacterium]